MSGIVAVAMLRCRIPSSLARNHLRVWRDCSTWADSQVSLKTTPRAPSPRLVVLHCEQRNSGTSLPTSEWKLLGVLTPATTSFLYARCSRDRKVGWSQPESRESRGLGPLWSQGICQRCPRQGHPSHEGPPSLIAGTFIDPLQRAAALVARSSHAIAGLQWPDASDYEPLDRVSHGRVHCRRARDRRLLSAQRLRSIGYGGCHGQ